MRSSLPGDVFWMFIFVDDMTLSVRAGDVVEVVHSLEIAAASVGLQLARRKCAIHMPIWRDAPDPISRAALEDATQITLKDDGIVLMGTVCNSIFATPLHEA